MNKAHDLTGQTFGKLLVVERLSNDKYNKPVWKVKCECGGENSVNAYSLKNGDSTSCGCNRITHGFTKHPAEAECNSWRAMITRCTNPTVKNYKNYGGRGIKVSERWTCKDGFLNFLEDMGYRPDLKHSLERINVNGDYEPSNCKWATCKEQSNNRRNNLKIEFNGEIKSITQWAKITGIDYLTLNQRIFVENWNIGDAFQA